MATATRRQAGSAYNTSTDRDTSYSYATPIAAEQSYAPFFQRGSISASSDSNSSSPVAPPSSSETPGTSPDTPAFNQSYSYPSLSDAMTIGNEPQFEIRAQPSSSPKRARNLKNLALNTSCATQFGRAISTASLPMDAGMDTPISPHMPYTSTFPKPAGSRRKGSTLSLTIQPPSAESAHAPEPFPQIPSVPKLSRPATLRQTLSTSSVPLASPGHAPTGGMDFPSITSRLAPAFAPDLREECQDYAAPESREAKVEAYPNGPICIYDPHVYLYLEPNADEASDYDVIFNVASEVVNPFPEHAPSRTLQSAVDALSRPSSQPKSSSSRRRPEYIHVPWEHNTDIVPDLYDLVKVVDDRVQRGQRVLIHCQCGVSRSASLIVAYGIFKDPSMTVQQAYDAVKQKSEWIGPNMNLIMQLQEFRTGLMNSGLERHKPRLHHTQSERISERKTRSGRSATESQPTGRPRHSQLSSKPRTNSKYAPAPIKTSDLEDVSPGPSSAPVDYEWPENQLNGTSNAPVATSHEEVNAEAAPKRPSRYAPPALEIGLANTMQALTEDDYPGGLALAPAVADYDDPSFGITSPREERFSMNSGSMFAQGFDALPTPRSTEFGMTSYMPAELSDTATLGLTSPREPIFTGSLPQRFASTSKKHSSSSHHSSSAKSPKESSSSSSHKHSSHTSSSSSRQQPTSSLRHSSSTSRHSSSTSPASNSTAKHSSSSSSSKHRSPTPPTESSSRSSHSHSSHRRPGKLPSLSTMPPPSSTMTSIDETLFSPRTTEFITNPLDDALEPSHGDTTHNYNYGDELMSPRATEFTENPIHAALEGHSSSRGKDKSSRSLKSHSHSHGSGSSRSTAERDPRSPPLRGSHPINRNIADVL